MILRFAQDRGFAYLIMPETSEVVKLPGRMEHRFAILKFYYNDDLSDKVPFSSETFDKVDDFFRKGGVFILYYEAVTAQLEVGFFPEVRRLSEVVDIMTREIPEMGKINPKTEIWVCDEIELHDEKMSVEEFFDA